MDSLPGNLKDIYMKLRSNGWLFAIIAFSINLRIWGLFPTTAMQGAVSLRFSELILMIAAMWLLVKFVKKDYVLKETSLKIFIVFVVSCGIIGFIALYHVLINGTSLFEFFGFFVNIFGCVLIYFLADAKFFFKDELKNGIINFTLLYAVCAIIFSADMAYLIGLYCFAFVSEQIAKAMSIAVLSIIPVALIFSFYCLTNEPKPRSLHFKTIFIFTSAILFSQLMGIRIMSTMVIALLILLPFIFWRYRIIAIKMQAISLILAILCFGIFFVTTPFGQRHMIHNTIRANSHFISVIGLDVQYIDIYIPVLYVQQYESYSQRSEIIYEPIYVSPMTELAAEANELVETTVEIELTMPADSITLTETALQSAIESGSLRRQFFETSIYFIVSSPLLGAGMRMVPVQFGEETVMWMSHNLILDFLLLVGVVGLLSYLGFVGYIYFLLIFRKGLNILEKVILTLSLGMMFSVSLLQPSITTDVAVNLMLWSIITYMFSMSKSIVCSINPMKSSNE